MEVIRIKCTECDNMILPQTAESNDGLCGQCRNISESTRRAIREFKQQLASGLLFVPSQQEWDSAKQPVEFGDAAANWKPDPEYHKDTEAQSALELINHAVKQSDGHVFLISNSGARLSLSFNKEYGVCEYQNEESDDYLYAYTPKNLREQVTDNLHLAQVCSCCGVGMFWYPSRFHMPRLTAFEVISVLVRHDIPPDVDWLESGDFSDTACGQG